MGTRTVCRSVTALLARILLTSAQAAALPASYTPSPTGRRIYLGSPTTACVICRIFPCSLRTRSGSMRCFSACQTQPREEFPATTRIPPTPCSTAPGALPLPAPQFASIQALINQKAGAPQGNPDPIIYSLARSEYGTASDPNKSNLSSCNASQGNKIGSSCVFNDVTAGNINEPCYGTNNCYNPSPAGYGLMSTSDTTLIPAYPTTTGWDFATGLGSVNVTNLVNSWP